MQTKLAWKTGKVVAMEKLLEGKPYAVNPHVRFDEGEVVPAATSRRGSLLYKLSAVLGLMVGGTILTGCMSSKVGWIEEGDIPRSKTGGCYDIMDGTSGIDISRMKVSHGLKTGEADTSEVPAKGSPLPILIKASSQPNVDVTGAFGMVNNFFSVCTLGIWPFVETESCACNIEIETPQGKVSHAYTLGMRRWSSFIFPIAALPCPGIGDWRSSPYTGIDGAAETSEFKRDMAMELTSGLLTEKFYNQEMGKHIDYFQKRVEKKRKVARKLQDIIDGN